MRSFLEVEDVLYVDLPGKHASENPSSTVPVSILATSARPDMVLIRNMVITLIELIVPYDSRENLRNARARKSQKSSYLELLGDLETKGFLASLLHVNLLSWSLSPVFYPGLLGGGKIPSQKLAILPLIYPKDNRKAILMASVLY